MLGELETWKWEMDKLNESQIFSSILFWLSYSKKSLLISLIPTLHARSTLQSLWLATVVMICSKKNMITK
jgi:hypothetical protein